MQETTLEFTAEISKLTASIVSDSKVVGSETSGSIDIQSDSKILENDVVIISGDFI